MKQGMITGVLIGVLVFTATSLAEDITLTTYYPAPYGEYEELYVSGNVGIGTTEPITYPTSILTKYLTIQDSVPVISISGSTAAEIILQDTGATSGQRAADIGVDEGKIYIRAINDSATSVTFNLCYGDLLTGSVGIGTTNPAVALHVVGKIRCVGAAGDDFIVGRVSG